MGDSMTGNSMASDSTMGGKAAPVITATIAVGVCLLSILACLLLFRFDNKYTAPGPQATEGDLRLDESALERYPAIHLVEGWAFYHGVLLMPEDFETAPPKPDEYIFIGRYGGFEAGAGAGAGVGAVNDDSNGDDDGDGNDDRNDDGDTSPHGSATYRLCIRIPDEPRQYMLELPEIFSAYRLYINGEFAAGMGDPDPPRYRPATGNRTVSFEAARSIELIFAVSDFTHFYSGLVYPPAFGDPDAVSRLLYARFLFRAVLVSIVLTLGLLSLPVGLLSRQKAPGLLYALLCLCYAIYAGYPVLKTWVFSYYPWYALENIAFCATLALVMQLQRILCGLHDKWSRALLWLGGFSCLAALIVHLTLPAGHLRLMFAYSDFMTAYEWIIALFITYTALRAIRRGLLGSRAVLCGILAFDCALAMDRLLPAYEPVVTGWFLELAGFVLILSVGIAVAREVAVGYRTSAVLTERAAALDRLSEMQQAYYRMLGERATEIETTRHDLRHHYLMIDRMIRERLYAELETYLAGRLTADEAGSPEKYCDHNAVNVLANHYHHLATQNHIDFELRCDLDGAVSVPDADLCGILGNLLENAMEACLRIETGRRFIRVSIVRTGSMLTLRVWNSTDEKVSQSGDGFPSSKRGGGTGYGLWSVQSIARKYGGETWLQWDKAERVFDSTVTLTL